MPRPVSFTRYLMGHASLERPPFFYGYAGMWVHFLVASLVLVMARKPLDTVSVASLIVGSCCLGILVYGVMSRTYPLLLNLFSYAACMAHLLYAQELGPVTLLISLLIAVVSAHLLLTREYQRYNEAIFADTSIRIPTAITAAVAVVVVLLCLLGLQLV